MDTFDSGEGTNSLGVFVFIGFGVVFIFSAVKFGSLPLFILSIVWLVVGQKIILQKGNSMGFGKQPKPPHGEASED